MKNLTLQFGLALITLVSKLPKLTTVFGLLVTGIIFPPAILVMLAFSIATTIYFVREKLAAK